MAEGTSREQGVAGKGHLHPSLWVRHKFGNVELQAKIPQTVLTVPLVSLRLAWLRVFRLGPPPF